MNLVGEVHTHGQLDEQVDAETIATLRDDGLTWTHKHSLISIIRLYIYTNTHTENRTNRVWEDGVLATWYGPVGSSTDHLLDQDSVDGVLLFTRPVAFRWLHVNKWLLMNRHDLSAQTANTQGRGLIHGRR